MTFKERKELLGTKVPKLADLTSRHCTVEELQAALVNLIEIFNAQGKAVQEALNSKEPRVWRATI